METIDIKRLGLDSIDICVNVLNQIEELGGLFNQEQIMKRLVDEPAYILVAYIQNQPVACKLAYNRYDDGAIYSWLGGVLAEHRHKNIASLLLEKLEELAKADGFTSIRFKTQNRHRNMLHLAIQKNFNIVDFEADDDIEKSVIVFERPIR